MDSTCETTHTQHRWTRPGSLRPSMLASQFWGVNTLRGRHALSQKYIMLRQIDALRTTGMYGMRSTCRQVEMNEYISYERTTAGASLSTQYTQCTLHRRRIFTSVASWRQNQCSFVLDASCFGSRHLAEITALVIDRDLTLALCYHAV